MKKSKSSWRSRLSLLILLPLFAAGCGANQAAKAVAESQDRGLHSPDPGDAVADELDRVCPITKDIAGHEISSCPAIDDFFARYDRYQQQEDVQP